MKVTTANLADLINSVTVGFDDIMSPHNLSSLRTSNFPPHNIIKSGENKYRIEFALAGYSKQDVEVTVQDGELSIKGTNVSDDDKDETKYLHQGIANRSFVKTFKLEQDLEVTGGEMENGILYIDLERIIPEHKKPKLIKLK